MIAEGGPRCSCRTRLPRRGRRGGQVPRTMSTPSASDALWPRLHVRNAGPLNQLRIVASSRPRAWKTLYWTSSCSRRQRTSSPSLQCQSYVMNRYAKRYLSSHREGKVDPRKGHPVDQLLPVGPRVPDQGIRVGTDIPSQRLQASGWLAPSAASGVCCAHSHVVRVRDNASPADRLADRGPRSRGKDVIPPAELPLRMGGASDYVSGDADQARRRITNSNGHIAIVAKVSADACRQLRSCRACNCDLGTSVGKGKTSLSSDTRAS